MLFLKLSVLFLKENAAGLFPVELLLKAAAALQCLTQLFFQKIAGTAGFLDLPVGARFMIADSAGCIFLNTLTFLGDLFLCRLRLFQLTAHQNTPLLFICEVVFDTCQFFGMFFLSLLHRRCEFTLLSGCVFLCLAQICPELLLSGPAHFHRPVDPVLHISLRRLTIVVEQVQAHRAVLVFHPADHQLHPDCLFLRRIEVLDAENTAGNSFCDRSIVRTHNAGRHQPVTRNTGDLQSVERILQDILRKYTDGHSEHGWNIFARKKNLRPGPGNFRGRRFKRGGLLCRTFSPAVSAIDFYIPIGCLRGHLRTIFRFIR